MSEPPVGFEMSAGNIDDMTRGDFAHESPAPVRGSGLLVARRGRIRSCPGLEIGFVLKMGHPFDTQTEAEEQNGWEIREPVQHPEADDGS